METMTQRRVPADKAPRPETTAAAKKLGIKAAYRTLPDGQAGVWRL